MLSPAIAALNRVPWFWRRWFIGATVAWAGGVVTYIAIVGSDNTRSEIAFYLVGLIMSLIGSFVFGATWDSKNERKANIAASAIEVGEPAMTTVEVKQ